MSGARLTDEQRLDWLRLIRSENIGPRTFRALINQFGGAGAALEALPDLARRGGRLMLKVTSRAEAEKEMAEAARLGVRFVAMGEPDYPKTLQATDTAPPLIAVRGSFEVLAKAGVGIVGSRNASAAGLTFTERLARQLGEAGYAIVSGLARGIDTASHRGAMIGGGKTVAVLGTGIDGAYPKENLRLIKEILNKGGAVVSQFPLGTPPLKDNFPYRNRIISGLSLGVLIVEASERSGSLITARLAMEQNREVMAVPGNITSANSFGTNYLIKSGAKLVQQWQDVVAELPSEIAASILPPPIEPASETDGISDRNTPPGLSETELKVWSLLSSDSHVQIDDLLEASGLSFGDLNTALVALDIRDLIRVLPGKNYSRRAW